MGGFSKTVGMKVFEDISMTGNNAFRDGKGRTDLLFVSHVITFGPRRSSYHFCGPRNILVVDA